MATPDANHWPEFHLAKYANQVVLFLVAYSLYKWFNEDVRRLGFDSYSAFASWVIFAVSGNGLTLLVVSRRIWSKFWKIAFAVTMGVLVVSVIGLITIEHAGVSLQGRMGWSVAFVFLAHLLNLFTLVRVSQIRRRG